MRLPKGKFLQGGKYRIETCLGQGGFGITYLAVQVNLNRKVAIKEFFMADHCEREGYSYRMTVPTKGNSKFVARFLNKFIKEAQYIASLEHSHIIRIYDIFEENETAYYVMEYHSNGSLAHYLSERSSLEETMALRYIRQLADALNYVHQKQICHLDVKPENILLDVQNNVILIDFGVAKQYDDEGRGTSTTPLAVSEGYTPIEQYEQRVNTFSPATDIYSLGATLYKMLSGNNPPKASDLIQKGFPSLQGHISVATVSAVKQAMRPIREERPQSISEFLDWLDGKKSESSEGKTIMRMSEEIPAKQKRYIVNGRECVDLGLSVKWATCNVGSSVPEESGDYFSWGEICQKSEYTEDNCSTNEKEIGDISGEMLYDAARAHWGGKWRLPTKSEFMELEEKCQWIWTTQEGRVGQKVIGVNGNSIFLPASGCCKNDSNHCELDGEEGRYWSSLPYESNSQLACFFGFDCCICYWDWEYRYIGNPIRPVSD